MDITLNHDEIVQALVTHVGGQGINLDNKKVSVNLVAGRGANGFTAIISLDSVNPTVADDAPFEPDVKAPAEEKPKAKPKTKKVSKKKAAKALNLEDVDPDAEEAPVEEAEGPITSETAPAKSVEASADTPKDVVAGDITETKEEVPAEPEKAPEETESLFG